MRGDGYRLERCLPSDDVLSTFDDHTLFQTKAWLDFVVEAQGAEIVTANVVGRDGDVVGRFTGLVVRAFGLRILGSPLPGWTTSYMGFNLRDGADRTEAMLALKRFAFRDLQCVHVEIADRHAAPEHLTEADFIVSTTGMTGYEVDLSGGPEAVLANMKANRRRNIKKAERLGVQVEVATDDDFVVDFYGQLKDVFEKQGLVPPYGIARVRALIDHLGPTGRLLRLRARDPSGRCVATGIFPAANGTMYFWGGASWRDSQAMRPNEAIHWQAMRYWMERGIQTYDMVGRGTYKERYGAYPIFVPWGRASRFPVFEHLRNLRRTAHEFSMRIAGRLPSQR